MNIYRLYNRLSGTTAVVIAMSQDHALGLMCENLRDPETGTIKYKNKQERYAWQNRLNIDIRKVGESYLTPRILLEANL